jgi:GT2 family glycosyltransferase
VTAIAAEAARVETDAAAGIPAGLLPAGAVRVEIAADGAGLTDQPVPGAVKIRRVAVVVPCFNRREDAEALMGDLARVGTAFGVSGESPGRIELRVLLVDNASSVPLATVAAPTGVRLEHLRLSQNTGGSGGYNAGMRRVLALDDENEEAQGWRAWDAEYVWLVDSDARVAPDTLRTLLEVLETDGSIVAAGSAICDPLTGQAFELGGHVNRRNGNYEPMVIGQAGVRELVEADYLAACCALVRADAVRDTGVFPDRFLNGDDVEWFVRMKAMTGGRVVGVPTSVAMHPRFDRFPTWTRYYMTRNAFGPLDAVGGDASLRRLRALREVPRAVQQEMMGRPDLARLHLAGLRHAAQHRTIGPAPEGLIRIENPQPLSKLSAVLIEKLGMGRPKPSQGRVLARLLVSDQQRTEVNEHLTRAGVVVRRGRDGVRPEGLAKAAFGAAKRLVLGPEVDVAVVPARGRPDSWFLGRWMVAVTPQGFVLRQPNRFATAFRAVRTLAAGGWHALSVGRRGEDPGANAAPWLHEADPRATGAAARCGLSLCAVVLSHNRWAALDKTLRSLRESGLFALDAETTGAEAQPPWSVLVVDNASSDGSAGMVERSFPGAKVLRLNENLGVEAFNRGVEATDADVVLILDDDATPDPRALRRAMQLLARRPELGAVTLHPRHPRGGKSEWSFARRVTGTVSDSWPVMGCGNLVRRDAWKMAGGYEPGYFLYRNDADLSLKMLGLGLGVHFNPAWVVWHDTAAGAGARKSEGWHRLATRNWIWMARRHANGWWDRWHGAALGWGWAHRLAGFSLRRQIATLRGGLEGLRTRPPAKDHLVRSGAAWRDLLRLLTSRG